MTLGRKMAYQTAAMIVGLLTISAASLWAIGALSTDYGVAMQAYQDLRHVYAVRSYLEAARELVDTRDPQRELAGRLVYEAMNAFGVPPERDAAPGETEGGPPAGPEGMTALAPGAPASTASARGARAAVEASLRDARRHLLDRSVRTSDGGRGEDVAAVGSVLDALARLELEIRATFKTGETAAGTRRRATMVALSALAALTILGALVLGVLQYRDVVLPLSGLAWAVRRITRGRFGDRVDFGARGRPSRYPAEFVRLADDFNRMACELDELYHKLEAKVASKSKELVRSERLASVGFLAAGVAHEINNPLGIIVGYAECLAMELKEQRAAAARQARGAAGSKGNGNANAPAGDGEGGTEDILKTLQIICDEAFRCKSITSKLLSMAKPGEDARRAVNLGDVAAGVVSVLGGVRPFRDRRLGVRAESASRDDLVVTAVEAEMKQVVMNLAINALEAIAPPEGGGGADAGEVRITVARRDGSVEIAVSDTGRGMSPETLERVFEPFFTEKRGAGTDMGDTLPQAAAAEGLERRHGTGLGLSITHAIVEAHGGRITAHSDGPGKGSLFTVRLPAAVPVGLATPELTQLP